MENHPDIEIGKNIAGQLGKLGMTAYELAKSSDIHHSTISRAIRGEMSLKVDHMHKICQHLQLTISELTDIDPDRTHRRLTGVRPIDDAIEIFYGAIWQGREIAQKKIGHIISPSYRFHNCDGPLHERTKITFKEEMTENHDYFNSLHNHQGQIVTTIHSATIVDHRPMIHLTVMRPVSKTDRYEPQAYKVQDTIKRHETVDVWKIDKTWREVESSGSFQLVKRFMRTINVNYNQNKTNIVTTLNI